MAATATALVFDLLARDNASKTFLTAAGAADKLAASASRSEAAMSRMKAGLITAGKLGATIGAFELAKKAIDIGKEASSFQRSMTLIQTQAGASSREIQGFSKSLLSMSGRVAQAPEELATSLYHVYSVGLRGAKALDTVRIAAEGARVGNANLEETTNALTSTVASGIKGAGNMAKAMGALNTIVGAGDMKLSDLNDALGGGILTAARSFGVNLTQVGAALAVFGDNNVRGADAATQLRMSIMALAKPIAGGAQYLDQIGLSGQRLQKDLQHGGLTKALDDLTGHMRQAGIVGNKVGGFITDAFGRKAGIGLSTLVEQAQRFHLKLSEIGHGANTFQSAWKTTTKTTAFQFAQLNDTIDAVGISVLGKVTPAVGVLAKIITGALSAAFSIAGSAAKPFGSALGLIGDGARLIGSALSPLAGLMKSISGPLKDIATVALSAYAGLKLFAAVNALMTTVGIAMKGAALTVLDLGTAARGTATSFLASSGVISGAADATAADVAVAGTAASIGWRAMLGPVAAVAIGVGALISIFHKSSGASKEATDAAKAYTDALTSGGGRSTIIDSITSQLKNNNVPETLKSLNTALGKTAFTGTQFVNAIQSGDPALDKLRDRLQAVIDKGTTLQHVANSGRAVSIVPGKLTPAAQAATAALAHLNTQYKTLSNQTRKDLINTKAFAGVSSSIDKVSASTLIGTDTAKQYAQMVGISVHQDGVAAVSANVLNRAVSSVSRAYSTATQTGNDFLAALNSFSGSSGTAADRAALIGATLKENAGDALNFASAINNAAVATKQLGKDVSGKLLKSVVDLKSGTINYSKAAAAPLISDLQSMQTAAISAAQATFQHNRAFEGGKKAADDALNGYKGVEDSLVSQLTKMGLTSTAAQKLTDKYLGVPKNVKTLIEQEGADPVLTVLNKIGLLLARFTGQPWNINVDANTDAANAKLNALSGRLKSLGAHGVTGIVIDTGGIRRHARGGTVIGGGTDTSDSVLIRASRDEEVTPAKQARKYRPLLKAIARDAIPGYARGGTVGDRVHTAQDWVRERGHLPYVYGATGPGSYDCSGYVGGAIADYFGHPTNRRLFSTSNEGSVLPGYGFKRGTGNGQSPMVVGWQNSGGTHHTTGMIGGLKFEARDQQEGLIVGSKAKDPRTFPNVMHLPGSSAQLGGDPQGGGLSGRAAVIAKDLQGQGAGRAGIAAALGNFNVESGLDPTSVSSSGAVGIAQWQGSRLAGLKRYAKARHQSYKSLKAQLGFLNRELHHGYGSTLKQLQHGTDARKVAAFFDQHFEGSDGSARGKRESRAASYFRKLAGGIDGSSGSGASGLKALADLRVKIHGSDIRDIRKALTGTVLDTKRAFNALFADMTKAKIPGATQAAAKKVEKQLLAGQSTLITDKRRLAGMKAYRSTVTGALSQFDPTQYGSVPDLIAGLQGATATNRGYTGDVTKLRGMAHGNKNILALVNQLEASGSNASLHALATGGVGQLRRAASADAAYRGSALAGGNAAVLTKYGTTIPREAATVATLSKHLGDLVGKLDNLGDQVAHVAAAVAHAESRPAVIGKEALAKNTDKEIERILRELTREHSRRKLKHG